jgi:hypothetical protein
VKKETSYAQKVATRAAFIFFTGIAAASGYLFGTLIYLIAMFVFRRLMHTDIRNVVPLWSVISFVAVFVWWFMYRFAWLRRRPADWL